jgi:hypothetical protein
MEVSDQITSLPLYPRGKSPHCPLDRRLCGPQSRSERGGEHKKIPALAGDWTPGRPPHSSVAVLTDLLRLLKSRCVKENDHYRLPAHFMVVSSFLLINYYCVCYITDCFSGVMVKVKLSLCLIKHHAMKAYWGSGGIAPRILWLRH